MRWLEYLIYLFLFILPWQTRLILRPGVINGGNWEYGIVGIYGTEILLWMIVLLSLLRRGETLLRKSSQQAERAWFPSDLPAEQAVARKSEAERERKFPAGKFDSVFSCNFSPFLTALLIIILFSIFLAADRLIAFQQFIHILEAIAIFTLLIKSPINRLKAAYAFLTGLAVQAILGIYQFLTQSTFAFKWLGLTLHDATIGGASVLENLDGRWLRAYAGLPHPNIFGGYMAVGVLISVVLLSRDLMEKKTRIFLLTANLFLLAGLFFSFSRSAWLSLIVGLTVFLLFNRRRFVSSKNFQLFFFSSVLLLTVLSLFYAPLLKNRISGKGRLEARAVEERIGGYGEALELFKKHPFEGVGLGNYTLAVHDEIDSSRPAWGYQPAHNVFLLMFVELGVASALIVLFICYLAGFKICRNLLPFFALFFVLGFFDHYLWSLYSGLALVGVGGGLFFKSQRIEHHGN